MKLPEYLKQIEMNDRPADEAAPYLMWAPPSGAPVECPTVETAQRIATALAGRKPGTLVAVYARVGFAYVSIKPPDFTPSEPGNPIKQIEEQEHGSQQLERGEAT